jgi:hypothetical protein
VIPWASDELCHAGVHGYQLKTVGGIAVTPADVQVRPDAVPIQTRAARQRIRDVGRTAPGEGALCREWKTVENRLRFVAVRFVTRVGGDHWWAPSSGRIAAQGLALGCAAAPHLGLAQIGDAVTKTLFPQRNVRRWGTIDRRAEACG